MTGASESGLAFFDRTFFFNFSRDGYNVTCVWGDSTSCEIASNT